MYCWSWTSVICVLFSHGFIGAAWTANVTVGDNATLSWCLPKPTNKEFTVWNTRSGRPILSVTNYNNVTDMTLESRITFTGIISPSGAGLFRFVISDVRFLDEGRYGCYVGPPENRRFTIDNCGQTLFVMASSTVYTHFGETTTLAWNLHGSGMEEFLVRNDFWKETFFHITNYNLVDIPAKKLRSRIVFTGNITSTGTGLFRFRINGADDHHFGQYSCYKGSIQRPETKVPNCGQNLAVIRVQEPYIASPEKVTVGDSENLVCYSFLKSYPFTNLTMSFIWSRNGTRVEHDGKHRVVSDNRVGIGGRLMTSTLIISGVTKKDRAGRYTCQTVVGENLLIDQSVDNALGVSYIPDTPSKNAEVEVGDNALLSMKTPLRQSKMYVIGPTDTPLFEMNATAIYVREAYWTKIKIMKVIISLTTVSVQFQLSDITSSDGGTYYCSLDPRGQIGCDWKHFLAVSNATVTVPASSSVVTSTTGYMTSTSTVRSDVVPTTLKASSVPADDDANATSAGDNSTSSGQFTSTPDGLTPSTTSKLATSTVSSEKAGDNSTSSGQFTSTPDGPTPSTTSKLATSTVSSEKGGLEDLIVVSIGFSVATTFIISVIAVVFCRRTFKRRRGDWTTRSTSSPAPEPAPAIADNRIYFEIDDIRESQAGTIEGREEATNLRRDYTNSCGYHELRHLRLKKDSVLHMTGIDMDDYSSVKSMSTLNQYDEPWI
ncbi:uncharacterized protein [Haliotis asinina]|uniref:uncharacterized protein n=1 Tax=Haliotis asinina TaxID=109174 RepID=UPI003531D4AB